MSVKSAEDRLANYVFNFVNRGHSDWTELRKRSVTERTSVAFQAQVAVQEQVRVVLSNEPVVTMDYPKYYGFGYSVMARMRRALRRDDLKADVQERRRKWVVKGCPREILDRIVVEVFDLGWTLDDGALDQATEARAESPAPTNTDGH